MGKLHIALLIFTFASGFGGSGYGEFTDRMRDRAVKLSGGGTKSANLWPVGSFWSTRTKGILCLAAMAIALVETWGAYGLLTVCVVAVGGALCSFVLTLLLKQHIQFLYLIGITAGTVLSLLGPTVFD